MTDHQARRLGELLRNARKRKGLPQPALAELVGVHESWLLRLEQGQYTNPDPVQLARLVDALDIDAKAIDLTSGDYLAHSLPSTRIHLRSKEDLSPQAIEKVVAIMNEERAKDARRQAANGGTS